MGSELKERRVRIPTGSFSIRGWHPSQRLPTFIVQPPTHFKSDVLRESVQRLKNQQLPRHYDLWRCEAANQDWYVQHCLTLLPSTCLLFLFSREFRQDTSTLFLLLAYYLKVYLFQAYLLHQPCLLRETAYVPGFVPPQGQ